jgi:hypothetical protein
MVSTVCYVEYSGYGEYPGRACMMIKAIPATLGPWGTRPSVFCSKYV